MKYWFTNYEGESWDLSKGFSPLFALVVRSIREEFGLEKKATGLEEARGEHWEIYPLVRRYAVWVKQFTWTDFPQVKGRFLVRFGFQIALAVNVPNIPVEYIRFADHLQVAYRLSLSFPPDYPHPILIPQCRVLMPEKYKAEDFYPHEHHVYPGGLLDLNIDDCQRQKMAVPDLLRTCFRLLAWHYDRFDW